MNRVVSVHRSKTFELYRIMLRAAPYFMPTKEGQTFWKAHVQREFRRNARETNPQRIEYLLQKSGYILTTLAEKN